MRQYACVRRGRCGATEDYELSLQGASSLTIGVHAQIEKPPRTESHYVPSSIPAAEEG